MFLFWCGGVRVTKQIRKVVVSRTVTVDDGSQLKKIKERERERRERRWGPGHAN